MRKNHLFVQSTWQAYFVFLAVLLCCADPAWSVYPQPTSGKRVYDFASLLSAGQETQLEQLTAGIAEATTAELDIVTVSSLHGETIEEYANNLFNDWAIGRADTNNGVLFLIAPNERRVRIEVGYGLEPLLTDGLCGNIIAQNIIPAFKAGNFDEGIISGAERIAGILQQHPEQAQGVKHSAPAVMARSFFRTLTSNGRGNMIILTVACIAFGTFFYGLHICSVDRKRYTLLPFFLVSATALLLILWATLFAWENPSFLLWAASSIFPMFAVYKNITLYKRFHRRKCPACADRLRLLNEQEENEFLDDGEKAEKKLDSVDYDVWLCGTCGHVLKRTGKVMSRCEQCPKCGYRTIEETIVRSATTSSTGLTRMRCAYAACGHEYTEVIPRVSRSSGSGGSSSGGYSGGSSGGYSGSSSGGSSGGGGASGGW
ncbi:MAG: TPM domain-containing protein [Candidatus Electrothrix aestuarii]|uniref:TPM domain-containing protein n=1 Tax=Candidatus Electrothrix aestuarii TaxID=3062594 RepID=A0AAU8M1B8_9BACT|nr:TPM domain-containing protein [Candidatus Electrothrix aestuarii]